jgi:hypothetical protein
MTLACAPALSLVADGAGVAGVGAAGKVTWLDTTPVDAVGAGVAPGADDVTLGVATAKS